MARLFLLVSSLFLFGCSYSEKSSRGRPSPEELRPLLNSERIERIFGSYGIEVLQNRPVRVSNLYSQDGDIRTCRTFAVVEFAENIPQELAQAYQQILAGESLGATLKKAGWKVDKQHRFFGGTTFGQGFYQLARLDVRQTELTAAIHIYALYAQRNGESTEFARIAEIHHPDYLSFSELKEIYADHLAGNLELNNEDLEMYELARMKTVD